MKGKSTELMYTEIRSKLYEAHAICRKHLCQAAKRQRDVYNTKTLVHTYKAGDIVWLLNEKIGDSECPKFRSAYIGPCVVLKVLSELVFKIQLDARGESRVVNHNKLLPYIGNTPPKWVLKLTRELKSAL